MQNLKDDAQTNRDLYEGQIIICTVIMSRRREKLRGEWPQGARDLGEEVGGGSSENAGAGTDGGGL